MCLLCAGAAECSQHSASTAGVHTRTRVLSREINTWTPPWQHKAPVTSVPPCWSAFARSLGLSSCKWCPTPWWCQPKAPFCDHRVSSPRSRAPSRTQSSSVCCSRVCSSGWPWRSVACLCTWGGRWRRRPWPPLFRSSGLNPPLNPCLSLPSAAEGGRERERVCPMFSETVEGQKTDIMRWNSQRYYPLVWLKMKGWKSQEEKNMLEEGDFTFQVLSWNFENKVNIKMTKLGDKSRNLEMNNKDGEWTRLPTVKSKLQKQLHPTRFNHNHQETGKNRSTALQLPAVLFHFIRNILTSYFELTLPAKCYFQVFFSNNLMLKCFYFLSWTKSTSYILIPHKLTKIYTSSILSPLFTGLN